MLSPKVKETQAVIATVMEVQPKESSESTEKSTDDIVYELAETILGRLSESIDTDECLPSLLWVNKIVETIGTLEVCLMFSFFNSHKSNF